MYGVEKPSGKIKSKDENNGNCIDVMVLHLLHKWFDLSGRNILLHNGYYFCPAVQVLSFL